MAFDWTKLEGYREDMTSDEKIELLNSYEQPEPAVTGNEPAAPGKGFVTKAQFDKVSSDLAAAKKQLRSKMTEDEQREADRVATETAMREELEALRKEKALNSHKASFLAQGYEENLADEAATAMVEGDTDAVFSVMKRHAANMEKELRAKILKDTPVPPAGNEPEKAKEKQRQAMLRSHFGLPPTTR